MQFPRNYTPHTGPTNPSHEGDTHNHIIYIVESPWKSEGYQGQPLCGASGQEWNSWLLDVGLNRNKIRIENLYPYVPPTREITSVCDEELIYWIRDLHRRMAALPCPHVIVTAGNYATFALTGKGKVRASLRNAFTQHTLTASEADKKAGITSLRGSVYPYTDANGRTIKVIPSIHPSAVLQNYKWRKRSLADWRKAKREAETPDYFPPQRRHIIDPCEWEVENYVKFVETWWKDIQLAMDIETWGNTLSCVGFAYHELESITIPTASKEQKERFLPYIKRLSESGADKVLCNGFFDWYWLDSYGVQINNFKWDVQLMHHAFDPIENHSLDFLSSVFCKDYQYWKAEAKDAEEVVKYAKDLDALWVYNGLDCCYTHELKPILEGELRRRGLLDFYFRHYQAMIEPLLRMMRHGVRVDKQAQKSWAKKLNADIEAIHQKLNRAAGEELYATEEKTDFRKPTKEEWAVLLREEGVPEDVPKAKLIDKEARQRLIANQNLTYMMSGKNAGMMRYKKVKLKKSFSTQKLLKFFYETLGVPKQHKRKKGTKDFSVSLDEGAIRKLNQKFPDKMKDYGLLLLLAREKKKEADYLKGSWDPDGRVRCSYKMVTEAGRLSSAKNPMKRGMNLQNIKR